MLKITPGTESLVVEIATGGPAVTNGYIVADPVSRRAVMVDAPYDATGVLLELLSRHGWSLEWLLLTHGHWDHLGEHAAVTAATGAKVAIHPGDDHFLSRGQPKGMGWDEPIPTRQPDAWLTESSPIAVGRLRLTVIPTPGHSPGGVCLLLARQDQPVGPVGPAEMLFSGDTLFAGSIGRLDLPGGNPDDMLRSLRRLMELPDGLRVRPGHGPDTTIGHERQNNPYIRQALNSVHL